MTMNVLGLSIVRPWCHSWRKRRHTSHGYASDSFFQSSMQCLP